jgi:chemotaxis signal transduction protein
VETDSDEKISDSLIDSISGEHVEPQDVSMSGDFIGLFNTHNHKSKSATNDALDPDYEFGDWSSEREIHCLLFTINNEHFAAPLITLGHIFDISPETGENKVYRIPNLPSWIKGTFQGKGYNTTVLDGRRTLLFEQDPHENAEHVLTFGQGDWGITCNSVSQAVWIPQEKIQWRNGARKRPWSCGIYIDKMCTILDIPLIIDCLHFNQK